MHPSSGPPGPACPVCGAPVSGAPSAPCPSCGLPAAGQAGWMVARIGATLDELGRDRDALLATLRAAAPGAAAPRAAADAAAWAPRPRSAPEPPFAAVPQPQVAPTPPASWVPPAPPPPAPPSWPPADPARPAPPPRPRRQLSPPQVLLGLGALSLVAAALAFVALAWTALGLVFQAAVMVTVTAGCCGASAWAARRGLRATEEALAAAGVALLAVDLGAARARGLGGLDQVGLRTWTAMSCLVVVAVAVLLGRLTRTTATWPLAALLAAQPVVLLLLPPELVAGPGGVAVALGAAALDLAVTLRLRPGLVPVAQALALLWTTVGVLGGLVVAASDSPVDSWTATALLTVAGAAAVLAAGQVPRLAGATVSVAGVAAAAGAVSGLALTSSLLMSGSWGPVLGVGLGLLALTVVPLLSGPAPLTGPLPPSAVAAGRAALLAFGAATAVVGALALADADRDRPLAVLVLAAALPAALTAVRVPRVRGVGTGAALAAPVLAVLLAQEGGVFGLPTAGLLLALLAAGAFALATVRAGAPEEWVLAAGGTLTGALAGLTTGAVEAWGQVAVQLAVVGVAAGCYALVAHRRLVAVAAVADLVLAGWIAVGGAGIQTPEAYTLPAAVGLLVIAWPRLRAHGPSWAAEGAAAGVALVPSALLVAATPTTLRLVLVVAGAVGLVVVGTLTHRQAPFVLGAGALALVAVTRLGPYAPLLPTWVTLATAGLLLIVLGATYERRLQQAREAVAWVAQMG